MAEIPELLTVEEVARLLRFSEGEAGRQAVRRLIRAGELPASRVGRAHLIDRADVLKLLEEKRRPVALAGGRTFERERLGPAS